MEWTLNRGRDLVSRHLGSAWSFGLDHARTRVGCCHYREHRVTISRHLIVWLADDEVEQTILHEVAHAQIGNAAGHGPAWVRTARALGYTGERTIEVPESRLSARWYGVCPAGHELYRHRRPPLNALCSTCLNQGHRRQFQWTDRGLAAW